MLTAQAKSKRRRLEMLHRHRPGCRFPMIEDMTEEMSDYFDVIGITKVVTNIFRYFYDPSYRVNDGIFKKFGESTKERSKGVAQSEKEMVRLLWKEWEIRDEIAKLRTLLGVLAPETYTEEGELRPVVEETPSSDVVPTEGWTNLHPKMVEQYNIAEMETKMLKQHHADQIDLLKEQQLEVEKLQRQQQVDVQMLLNEFDIQIREHKKVMMRTPEPDDPEFDVQLLQTQLGQMQTIQRKQLKSLQLTQHQELLTQQNLHKHETIQRLQGEGARQQASLHNMMVAHSQHEQLCLEHQDQIMEMVDEIQDHQQQTFEDSLAIIENRRVNKLIEPPDQVLKRTEQQLQQLHAKQVEQLETLQNQELVGLNRLHKAIRRNIELQIKYEQQNKPKQIVHTNAIGQQDAQIKKLFKLSEENKELINVISNTIEGELTAPQLTAVSDTAGSISGTSKATSKSEDVLDSVNQVAAFQAKIVSLQQQMIHQELPYSTLPKVSDSECNFRNIQETILNQQRRVQQQKFQQMALRTLLENLFELVSSQKVQEQGATNPYRQSQLEILEDCREMLSKLKLIHDKQRLRNVILQSLEDEINTFQISYWKKRQKKDEPIDNLGKSLLVGKLAKGNKKEMHPLQKLLFENQAMQNSHMEHQQKLKEALKKAQALSRPAIEQEIQLRRQQEKLLLSMMKDTDELEEEQNEELGPLDIQQNRIDALEAVQKWMTEIVHLESILVDKSYDHGFITAITIEIEDLEPLFQQAYTIQEEQIKTVLAQQEELVSGHEKIVKILSPNQLSLTEDQLRRQKAQLNQLKRDLQYFFKSFTDPFKTSKRMRMKTSEEDSKNKEFNPEIQNLLELLQNGLSDLCSLLKDKQKELKESMQKLAQQVLKHKMKFVKLMENHRHLLAQYQDLHIEPERQMILDLITLHKRLAPCLKIQQQKLNRLMYRLRKSQDQIEEANTAVEEEKEKTEVKDKKLKKKGSLLSVSSLHRVTLTGVVSKTDRRKTIDKLEIAKNLDIGDKIKSEMTERRKSVSRISIYMSEQEMTEEQREIRDRMRLIVELKDKQADVLHQVQLYNKPEIFRRVQTLTYPRGMKPKNHEELALYVAECRERYKGQPEFCPQKPIEYSNVEDHQKSFYKLFEKSEKLMVEKRESEHEIALMNLLKEINKENEEETAENDADKTPKLEKSLSRISMKKKHKLKKASKYFRRDFVFLFMFGLHGC